MRGFTKGFPLTTEKGTKDLSQYKQYSIAHIFPGGEITDEIKKQFEIMSRFAMLKAFRGSEDFVLEDAKFNISIVNPMVYGSIGYGYTLEEDGYIPLGPVVIGYRSGWVKGKIDFKPALSIENLQKAKDMMNV